MRLVSLAFIEGLTDYFASLTASLVPPSTPTSESGLYWGYRVRVASSLAQVFSESPFPDAGGYSLSIGTSERGTPIEELLTELPPFRCVLLSLPAPPLD